MNDADTSRTSDEGHLLFTIGLIFAAIVAVLLIVIAGWFFVSIWFALREARRADAQMATCDIAGLGTFSSIDHVLWIGDVDGLHISFISDGGPPDESLAAKLRRLVDDLPSWVAKARAFIAENAEPSRTSEASSFEPYGLEIEDESSFVLELTRKDDEDGVYRVEFRDGAR